MPSPTASPRPAAAACLRRSAAAARSLRAASGNGPRPLRAAALALAAAGAAALAGCASGRASLGNVNLRPYGDRTSVATSFGVQEGRIVSPDLDVVADPDGCLRGTVLGNLIQLCKQASHRDAEAAGGIVQRWSGTGGDFTLELMQGGRSLRADGYVRSGRGSLPLRATVPLGQGPQWDELRRDPALLALAAGVASVEGEPDADAVSRAR